MLAHMLRTYGKILTGAWIALGPFHRLSIRWLTIEPLRIIFVHFTLFLDNIFYPQYHQMKVEKPIFIMAHPRGGTTFLHRLLTQTDEYVVFRVWEILVPSLTGRRLLKPSIEAQIKAGKGELYPASVGHEANLDSVEEEELLFLYVFDTQFVSLLTPLGFNPKGLEHLVYNDREPHRRQSMAFFHGCLQRQLLYTGKRQVITKMNYSVMRMKTILEQYPDAKFIYIARSPLETIPSHLSLHRGMIGHGMLTYEWGADPRPPADQMASYYQRRYRYNVAMYQYFEELRRENAIPPEQLLEIPYSMLLTDLAGVVEKIVSFTGLTMSEELKRKIAEQCARQKSYQRKHEVGNLEEFGLTEEQIRKDLPEVFEHYGW